MFVINGTVALGEHGWPDMRARLETLLRKH